ncbi:MAG TPA: hypothetical protein VK277_02985 [Acidimicrobiales bacterium]|nr:hypothetical protein [Acidimicrobiales bacterium]
MAGILAVIIIAVVVWVTHNTSSVYNYSGGPTFNSPPGTSFTNQPVIQDDAAKNAVVGTESVLNGLHATQHSLGASSSALVSELAVHGPSSFTYTTGAVSTPDEVSVSVGPDGQVVVLAAYSATGKCFFLELNYETQSGNGGMTGTSPVRGTSYAESAGGLCAAGTPPGEGPSGPIDWGPGWSQ